MRYRYPDGRITVIQRYGDTKAAATAAVKVAARDLVRKAEEPVLRRTVGEVAAEWLTKDLPARRTLAPNTAVLYQGTYARHLEGSPLFGMAVAEVRPGHIEDLLGVVAGCSGRGSAKTAKSVLSSVFKRAVKYGECDFNPVLGAALPERDRRDVDDDDNAGGVR